MAADPQFVASINQLLENTLLPDTNTVKAATDGLQAQYKNPAIVPALFQILVSPTESGVRQLAAVELRKRISKSGKAWKNQTVEVRTAIKAKLLELVKDEPNNSVRNGSARVVCEIARRELPEKTWPELLPFLFAAGEHGNAIQRQAAVFVFFTLFETCDSGDETLEGALPQIMLLFSKTLNDPESLPVRVTTVRALGKVSDMLDEDSEADVATIQSAIPQMVQVLQQALDADDSDSVNIVTDVFDTLCLSELPIINNCLGDLLAFYLSTAARQDYEDEMREAVLNSVIWTINYKRQKVQQLQLGKVVVPHVMAILPTGDFDDDETNPATLALRVLDTMATELPPSSVWPVLLEQMQAFAQSPDPAYRASGLFALGITCEGLSETLRPQMSLVWQFVDAGLNDSEARVRRAAAMAIAYLCDQLGDEVVKHHTVIMPALMQMIAIPETQRDATRSLDRVLEILGDDVKQYLQPVMETLAGYLDTVPLNIQKSIIAAIGSAAHASKADFLPYFSGIMAKLTPYLQLKDTTNQEQMEFRAITQDAVGTFANAVGAEAFRPYFADTMAIAYDAFELDQPHLRECSFIFFSAMAKIFKDEFSQFLPQIAPKLTESLRQREHDPVPGASGDGTVGGLEGEAAQKLLAGTQDEDDDDAYIDLEDLDAIFGGVSSAVTAEKEVAADAIGEIFKYTRTGFLPYLQGAVSELVTLMQHFNQNIRKSAVASLFSIIQTLNSIECVDDWVQGLPVQIPISANAQQLIDMVMSNVMIMWADEDDRDTATQLCESLSTTLKEVGPALIAKHTNDVAEVALSIIEKRSGAQSPDGDGEDPEEDSSEYENLLISSAMDLVGEMANVLGAEFEGPLRTFVPKINKYYAPGRSVAERAAATSTIGALTVGMKEHITEFTMPMLTVLSHAVTDEDLGVRTNAVYAAGVLIENTNMVLEEHYAPLLTALQPALALPADKSQPTEAQALKDNAVGCLARMVSKNSKVLPMDTVFPLIFGGLPLLYDNAEWAPVLQLTIGLISVNDPVATQNIDDILRLFAHVLATPADTDDDLLGEGLRAQVIDFVRHINTQIPEKVQAAGLAGYLA